MDIKEIFDFSIELFERMIIAHNDAKSIEINKGGDGKVFVHCGDKEYINPNLVSFSKQQEIIQLCQFLKLYPNLTDQDLENILNCNKLKFTFLKEVVGSIPNFVDEARNHEDYKYIPYTYLNTLFFADNVNNVDR